MKNRSMLPWFAAIRKRYEETPLQFKLITAFIVMLLLVFCLNVYMYLQISRMISNMDQAYESNVQISELQSNLRDMQEHLYSYLNGDYDSLKDYYADRNDLEKQIDNLNDRPSYDKTELIEKNIRGLAMSYLNESEKAVSAYRGTDIEQYTSSYEDASVVYKYLETNIYALNNKTFTENTNKFTKLSQVQHYTQIINLALLIFASLVEVLVIFLVTSQLIAPLTQLADRANEIGRGNLDLPPMRVRSLDEVGKVTSAFNSMVVKINDYLKLQQEQIREENRLKEEQLKLEGLLKDSQLGALQAQINPHFLYNTLNAGSQLAMMEDAEQSSIFLERVAEYFRYNIHRAGHDVSLSEEISQVENYIFIMNTRYAGEIHYKKQMPVTIPNLRLPGMVLQPIVENAIDHGLRNNEGEKILVLSVTPQNDRVIVTVADNGEGFPDDKARDLIENTDTIIKNSNGKHGIGMANVISRLRLFFEQEDIIEIGTMPDGTGTQVHLILPYKGD